MDNLLVEKNVENNLELQKDNDVTLEEQKSFFETGIGKAVNSGLDIGLRLILPDLIEDQIIQVKDVLIEQGFKEGIKTIADSVVDFGKSVAGVFTGKFENITQVENAIKNGGIIDTTSNILESTIDLAKKNNLINSSTANLIKKGKNAILDSINNNLEDMLTEQIRSIENLDKYINNWEKAYENKDLEEMKKEFKKLETELDKVVPLENTIKSARKIENLHNLIVSRGGDFNLTQEELGVAEKLV